jgi:hypothetical protein
MPNKSFCHFRIHAKLELSERLFGERASAIHSEDNLSGGGLQRQA